MKKTGAVLALVLAMATTGCKDLSTATSAASAGSDVPDTRTVEKVTLTAETAEATAPPAPTPAARRRTPTTAPLLFAAAGGDGDSWKDRSGREYRLGLVNAPESGECFGAEATARRKALVRGGFRVRTYATDSFGRSVSLVSLPDGRNLNLLLAQQGFVDDRYLAEFRHENEALARQLDVAFAAAKQARRGLWGACTSTPQPVVAAPAPAKDTGSSCHADYATCIPVKGDGSGAGAANDLDCPDIGKLVQLRRVGVDPYRLDADRDGQGCDSYA